MIENSTNRTAGQNLELSEAEMDMIRTLREWAGADEYQLLIAYRDGAWNITLSLPPRDSVHGTGPTFEEAWDNMN